MGRQAGRQQQASCGRTPEEVQIVVEAAGLQAVQGPVHTATIAATPAAIVEIATAIVCRRSCGGRRGGGAGSCQALLGCHLLQHLAGDQVGWQVCSGPQPAPQSLCLAEQEAGVAMAGIGGGGG